MTPLRFSATGLLALLFASCASQKKDDYETANPYGTPDAAQASATPYQEVPPVNPVYDTPAAYEETTGAPGAPPSAMPAVPSAASPSAAPASAAPTGPATIHTVVAKDTLWGLSKQYKVSIESIKQANRMTKDTVVLGQKIVIPSAR